MAPNTTVLSIAVESNLANAMNFLIFDIILISLVFHLTSDVSGRLNYADLNAGEPRRLFLTSPPVIGGGLCSTRPIRAGLLLFARVLGMLLILATNLTINGRSLPALERKSVELVIPGSLSNFTEEGAEISMLRRAGCLGTANHELSPIEGVENITFYGEIRDQVCEVDKELVFRNSVKFSQKLLKYNLTAGSCVRNEKRVRDQIPVALYFCEFGRLACLFDPTNPPRVLLRSCRGIVFNNNLTYMADEGTLWPEMPREESEARIVSGIDWKDDLWFDSVFKMQHSPIEDILHATYGAQVANRTVTVRKESPRTDISAFWFVALALKVAIVVLLGLMSFHLWRQGFRTVAHDERRIAELLRRRIEDNDPRLTVRQDLMPNIYLNAERSSGKLQIYAAGRPGATLTQPGIAGNVDQLDNNYQIHLDEAQFY